MMIHVIIRSTDVQVTTFTKITKDLRPKIHNFSERHREVGRFHKFLNSIFEKNFMDLIKVERNRIKVEINLCTSKNAPISVIPISQKKTKRV